MVDVISYVFAAIGLGFGRPIGVSLERIRIYRAAKKKAQNALEELHEKKIL